MRSKKTRKASDEPKTKRAERRQAIGDIYVYEVKTLYTPEKRYKRAGIQLTDWEEVFNWSRTSANAALNSAWTCRCFSNPQNRWRYRYL